MRRYCFLAAVSILALGVAACKEERSDTNANAQAPIERTEISIDQDQSAQDPQIAPSAQDQENATNANNGAYATPTQQSASAFFQCGETLVEFSPGMNGKGDMRIANTAYAMELVPAASGAKYQNLSDETTYFWNKGDMALVAIDGKELPECTKTTAPPKPAKPYHARGNEPGWHLVLDTDKKSVEFTYSYGENSVSLPVTSDDIQGKTRTVTAGESDKNLVVKMVENPCDDGMSGEKFAHHVRVDYDGASYQGCGKSLIRDIEWRLEDMNKRGIIDRSNITLTLDNEGRVYGDSGCNYYSGSYTLEGENLRFPPHMASTMRACLADSLMQQEQSYLKTLSKITTATFDDTGALILSDGIDGNNDSGAYLLFRSNDE